MKGGDVSKMFFTNTDKKGRLICIVGPDGVGKTSVIKEIHSFLQKNHFKTMLTREPGGVPASEDIRNIIFKYDIDPITECLLFASARRENVVKNLMPALNEGKIVLLDRYFHCSLVYQGIVGGVGYDKVFEINKLVIENCMPDVTIILDLDSEIAMKRICNNNSDRVNNRFDTMDKDYHEKIRMGYLSLKDKLPNVYVVNANQSLNKVVNDCLFIIERFL